MSRTIRGSKGPGYDYWSKRPGTRKASSPGKVAKAINVRAERRINKKLTRNVDES